MPTYTLNGKHESILSSLSNKLSIEEGKRISKSEVLQRILDVVITEEELLGATDSNAVSFFRRVIYKLPEVPPENPINKAILVSKKLDY
jgi:hypothetical protein